MIHLIFAAFLLHPAISQEKATYICDLTDIISGRKIEGEAAEIEVIKNKNATIYTGVGKQRAARTVLSFQKTGKADELIGLPEIQKNLRAASSEGLFRLYRSTTDRGSEEFIEYDKGGVTGYRLNYSHPVLKEMATKGAKLEDHYFSCKRK